MILIKPCGIFVECVDEKGSHPGILRYSHDAIHGILQQRYAQMASLSPAIDREPSENHDGYRVRHVATHATRCELVRNGARGQGAITTDQAVLIADYKGAARRARLVGQCPALEPVVERGLAAVEFIETMRSRQRLRRAELQAQAFAGFLPQGAFTAMRRSSPGLRVGGASSSLVNCRNFAASSLKNT